MTDLPARLREYADNERGVTRWAALLREAAAEIERLTEDLTAARGDLHALPEALETTRDALRAAEQRADAAEKGYKVWRDEYVAAHNRDMERAEARCAALIEAGRLALDATDHWHPAHYQLRYLLHGHAPLPSGGEPTPNDSLTKSKHHAPTSPPAEPTR